MDSAMQPEDTPELRELYRGFQANNLNPLWTQIGDLMPSHPRPRAVPHVWRWADLYPLAQRSGDLVPVGRGGERRAIGLANPRGCTAWPARCSPTTAAPATAATP